MANLQIVLLLIGVSILGLIYFGWKWNEKRQQAQEPEEEPVASREISSDRPRVEPSFAAMSPLSAEESEADSQLDSQLRDATSEFMDESDYPSVEDYSAPLEHEPLHNELPPVADDIGDISEDVNVQRDPVDYEHHDIPGENEFSETETSDFDQDVIETEMVSEMETEMEELDSHPRFEILEEVEATQEPQEPDVAENIAQDTPARTTDDIPELDTQLDLVAHVESLNKHSDHGGGIDQSEMTDESDLEHSASVADMDEWADNQETAQETTRETTQESVQENTQLDDLQGSTTQAVSGDDSISVDSTADDFMSDDFTSDDSMADELPVLEEEAMQGNASSEEAERTNLEDTSQQAPRLIEEPMEEELLAPLEREFAETESDHFEEISAPPLLMDTEDPVELNRESESAQYAEETADSSGQDSAPVEVRKFEYRPGEGFEKISQIDYWVKLYGERDVSRDSVLAIYRSATISLDKKHSVFGLRMPDKIWCDLENESEDARFADLVVTIQLADQTGAISESEMTRFTSLISKLSESTGRGFSFMAPVESAVQQARSLDEFVRHYESIFVINIRPLHDDYFQGAMIDRFARQLGLEPDGNCFYSRFKPVGKTKVCLYSLANMSDTGRFDFENLNAERARGVTFFTKPAMNRSPGAVFAEMVDTAKAFASRIKGEAIAPGQDDLSQDDVDEIRRQIETVAREMTAHGMAPGSEEAARLF